MSTMQAAGFGQTLTRASLLPFFLFSGIAMYLLPSMLSPGHAPDRPKPTAVVWKAAYSQQYPGCVSAVLWPAAERPVAIVVLAADGTTARVSRQQARALAADGGLNRAIGACR